MSTSAGNTDACTAGELIDATAQAFAAADLFYGHGTDNPVE